MPSGKDLPTKPLIAGTYGPTGVPHALLESVTEKVAWRARRLALTGHMDGRHLVAA